ncbi:GNAT family N-acetyltransferase [Micromonospora sp. CB01531]|uniref:GNAT family N-acetyltransferase n=1 Tax=Micromonospora sp. CB01531 TaxID=1718947 RepID=UPI003FCFA60F
MHRMIVDRASAGRNIGGALLDWATKAAASKGCRWFRLDAWRTNEALHRYYENLSIVHGSPAERRVVASPCADEDRTRSRKDAVRGMRRTDRSSATRNPLIEGDCQPPR